MSHCCCSITISNKFYDCYRHYILTCHIIDLCNACSKWYSIFTIKNYESLSYHLHYEHILKYFIYYSPKSPYIILGFFNVHYTIERTYENVFTVQFIEITSTFLRTWISRQRKMVTNMEESLRSLQASIITKMYRRN